MLCIELHACICVSTCTYNLTICIYMHAGVCRCMHLNAPEAYLCAYVFVRAGMCECGAGVIFLWRIRNWPLMEAGWIWWTKCAEHCVALLFLCDVCSTLCWITATNVGLCLLLQRCYVVLESLHCLPSFPFPAFSGLFVFTSCVASKGSLNGNYTISMKGTVAFRRLNVCPQQNRY